jgi:hypothetical protein
MNFIFFELRQNSGIVVIDSASSTPMPIEEICSSSFGGLNPLRNSYKDITLFLKGLEKSGMNFGGI